MTDTKCIEKIQNPFGYYPRFPYCGYFNIDTYVSEIQRLYKVFTNIKNDITENKIQNPLLHITIGSAMEEKYYSPFSEDIGTQWRQLLPIHIQEAFESGKQVYHIIITPDEQFNPKKINHPLFFTKSDINWTYKGDMTYLSNKCKVMIFNTPMPHEDQKKINSRLDLIPEDIKSCLQVNVDTCRQTDLDIKFIENFYNTFENLLDFITEQNGITTCYSFAVFSELTSNSTIRNYQMFSEIKKYFTKPLSENNRLLAEWTYTNKCFYMIPYNLKPHNLKIYYAYKSEKESKESIVVLNCNGKNIILDII
jgi:hypothetical protein